ncbi:MAG: LLM class flavin-dependent oxidoreductase, partial [Actinomycetota bacterium]
VVDTTGLDAGRRATYLAAARSASATAVAVKFSTSAAECRRRNRMRRHPVPTKALDTMIAAARRVELDDEGWDLVLEPAPVRTVTKKLAPAVAAMTDDGVDTRAGMSQVASLRFGLLVSDVSWVGDASPVGPELARLAREAEAVGFDSLWMMDHLVQIPQVGRPWDPVLDPYATLAHVAAATERIRLGVLVSPVTFRHVVLLAKSIATLDVLSGGRAIAGIGAGSSPAEHGAFAIPFGSPAERLALLRDTALALRALLGPGGGRFDGEVIQLPDTALYPRPIQDPVPLVVGGSGDRTLRVAAEVADACNLFGDPDTVASRVDALRRHAEELGRDPAEIEATHLGSMLLGAGPDDLRDRIERLRPGNLGPDRFAERAGAGTVDDHEASFRRFAAAGVDLAVVSLPDAGQTGALTPFADLIGRFHRTH